MSHWHLPQIRETLPDPVGRARLQPGDEVLVLDALDDLFGSLLGQAHLLAHF